MTRILRFTPGDETSQHRADALFWVAMIGGNALQQKGAAVIRQRGRITRLLKAIGATKEVPGGAQFVLNPDATEIVFGQEDHTYLEKCWGAFEPNGINADRIADALDWFDAAEKVDPSAKAEPKE